MHYGDLTDSLNIINLIQSIKPDEIYNLAAQSHVASFQQPEYTANCDGIGTLRILEAIKLLQLTKKTKFYQASTSELYGLVQEIPQTEKTPFYPRTHMQLRNYMPTGLRLTIENHMEFMYVMEFYLIMKVQEEEKPCY